MPGLVTVGRDNGSAILDNLSATVVMIIPHALSIPDRPCISSSFCFLPAHYLTVVSIERLANALSKDYHATSPLVSIYSWIQVTIHTSMHSRMRVVRVAHFHSA